MRQTEKGDKGAFLRAVDLEAKGLADTLKLNLAHDFYLGHTLAVCAVTVASITVNLNADTNMLYFEEDMIVDIVDAATGLAFAATARTITAVDTVAKTITVSGAAVTTAVTDIVVRTATYGVCLTPLMNIVDDTDNIFGVTTASFPKWKSTVQTGAMTLDSIQEFLDKIAVASGKTPTAIVADLLRMRAYLALLQANRQYISSDPVPKVLSGGFKALEYISAGGVIEWISDRLAPAKTLFALHEPDLQVYSPNDFEFIEVGGRPWVAEIAGASGTDTHKAVLNRDMELGTGVRNSHGRWDF
jgi:hypothetical protein